MAPLLIALVLSLPLWGQPQGSGLPVMLDNAEVIRILAAPPPLTVEARVREVQERLEDVAADSSIRASDIAVVKLDAYTVIMARSRVLMAVLSQDAAAAGKTVDEVAGQFAGQLRVSVERYRARRAWVSHLKSGILLVLCWSLFALAVFGHNSLRQWLGRKVRTALTPRDPGGPARPAGQIAVWSASWLLTTTHLVISLILLAIFLALVSFSLAEFPATERLAFQARDFLVQPALGAVEALVAYLPDFVVLLIVFGVFYYIQRMNRAFFTALEKGDLRLSGFHQDWAGPTRTIVTGLLFAFGLVVAYPYMPGSDTEAFKGVSIFVGVLISIGSGSSVGNAISGIILTYMRPFRVGDWVKITDEIGDVIARSILTTRIRTYKNEEVTLPNSLVLSSKIVNYSRLATASPVIFHTTITIGYDAEWRKVHQTLLAAARGTRHVLEDPAPFVLQTSLNDFHVSYQINCYTATPHEMVNIYSELHERIQDSFNGAGIEILSPTFYALRDGNTVTIPEPNRPAGYQPPSFRVEHTSRPGEQR